MFKKSKTLKKPDDAGHSYEYALFLLNLSMRTENELREKMHLRGYFPEIIEKTVKRLFEDRYLDDAHYAQVYIESMKRYKYYGRYVMRNKLYEKKVPKEIIEQKLAELLSDDDERDIATRYVEKTFGALKSLKKLPYEEKQKIMRRVVSRGFTLDLAKSLVDN